MTMLRAFICLATLFFAAWAAPVWAAGEVRLMSSSSQMLSTVSGNSVSFQVSTTLSGELTLKLLTGDGDTVRQLRLGSVSAGTHQITWDGKDDLGAAVPDEAYTPRVELQTGSDKFVDDPLSRTGGEVMPDNKPAISGQSDITYVLAHPARVLIRVGLKGGAMMRSLAVWAPRPSGQNLQRWNGFDESGLLDLRSDRLAILVTAFRLPDFSVLTHGQPGSSYRDYRRSRGWSESGELTAQQLAAQPVERNGVRIARQSAGARYKDRDPRVSMALLDGQGKPLPQGVAVPGSVRVTVDLHPDDRWLMEETLYEVAFFIDGDFVSEEENGYVPITWLWNTQGLSPGPHLLTVNVTGFTGRVGTRTVQFFR